LVDLEKSKSSFKEMADIFSIDPKLLREYHQAFHGFDGKEHHHVKCFNEGGEYIIGINEPGIRAYLDDYWINEGEKDLNERIYNKTKWSIPLIALVITAISLGYSIYTIQQTQHRLQILEKQLLGYRHELQQKAEYIKRNPSQIPDSLTKK